jgi:hypothetical protein
MMDKRVTGKERSEAGIGKIEMERVSERGLGRKDNMHGSNDQKVLPRHHQPTVRTYCLPLHQSILCPVFVSTSQNEGPAWMDEALLRTVQKVCGLTSRL